MQLHPEHRNIAYGSHKRQVFDIYRGMGTDPSPAFVYFHGGGYTGGDKSIIHHRLAARLCMEGITFVSANYRLSDDPEFLAPLHDAARVLQFLRQQAADYHLDPAAVGVGGSSAGAASACWLALKPNPGIRCVAVTQAQTTLDPRAIRALIPGPTWRFSSYQKLHRLTPEQYDLPEHAAQLAALDFLADVPADAPPFFLWNRTPDLPLTPDLEPSPGIHHPVFGRALKGKLDPLGIECILRPRESYPNVEGEELEAFLLSDAGDFLVRHLLNKNA